MLSGETRHCGQVPSAWCWALCHLILISMCSPRVLFNPVWRLEDLRAFRSYVSGSLYAGVLRIGSKWGQSGNYSVRPRHHTMTKVGQGCTSILKKFDLELIYRNMNIRIHIYIYSYICLYIIFFVYINIFVLYIEFGRGWNTPHWNRIGQRVGTLPMASNLAWGLNTYANFGIKFGRGVGYPVGFEFGRGAEYPPLESISRFGHKV